MMQSLRQMLTCHWSARRIQRYLDADPAAPLTPGEIARLMDHLATCEKCSRAAAEQQALHRALSTWLGDTLPDEEAVARLRRFLDQIPEEHPR